MQVRPKLGSPTSNIPTPTQRRSANSGPQQAAPEPSDQLVLSATSGTSSSTPKNLAFVAERASLVAAAQAVGASAGPAVAQAVFTGLKTGFVDGYIDPQATLAQCRELAAKYPNLVELVEQPIKSHGYTGKREDLQGPAPLYYMRLGPRDSDRSQKVGVLQHAAPHAREHVNPITMVELAEQLCANYDPNSSEPAVMDNTRLMNTLDIFIAPQPNPDGANYSFYDDKGWRKNLAPFDGVDSGVDINRNYPYKWQKPSGANYQTYPGRGPASEPETRALIDVVDQNPNIKFVVDWHSHGEEVRRPLGVSKTDQAFYGNFHNRVTSAIATSRGHQYGAVESQVVEGASDDYWYHQRGVYSTIIETAKSFQPPVKEALSVAQECARGAREVLEVAADFADALKSSSQGVA